MNQGQKIAVIGAGVAGIVSAWLLSRKHQVVLFEKAPRIGGHTYTVTVPTGADAGMPLDMGFIVLNDQTYPLLHRFLRALEVPVRFADMSFSVSCERTGLEYGSRTLSALFAQRSNLLSPRFLNMLASIFRFWKVGREALARPEQLTGVSMREFLASHHFPEALLEDYIIPMGGAIWSSPSQSMADFPATTCLSFFKNHGLLAWFNQPRWQTVVGGSSAYLRAFERAFCGEIRCSCGDLSVSRRHDHVTVSGPSGEERFDHVVLAVHADKVLSLLADPSEHERSLFGVWRYQPNHTVLHSDRSLLPRCERAWASWNYKRERGEHGDEPISISYDMTRLQGLSTKQRYLVTLNPRREIPREHIIHEVLFDHPVYSHESVATQSAISSLNGTSRSWFAGSYLGFGFHEDAVRSAHNIGALWGETV